MNPHPLPDPASPRVAAKLAAIRRRGTGLAFLSGLLRTAALLLGAIAAAMLIDRMVGWFDPRARTLVTVAVLAAAAAGFAAWCLRPLARRRTLLAAAREVERARPQLEERWTTVTELAQSTDAAPVRGSESLIRQVGVEAEAADAAIQPGEIVPAATVLRAGRWFGAAVAALALFFALGAGQAGLLWQRFWQPGRDLSLTRVTAEPGDVWVPRGEPLTLLARIDGVRPAAPPQIQVRAPGNDARVSTMTARDPGKGVFQHGIDAVSETFEYRVRAGDGQTRWQRITAADRPRITEVRLRVTPPAYSRLPAEDGSALPNAVRMLSGSDLEVGFRSDQPLDRMHLELGEGRTLALQAEGDQWYRFRDRPTNSFTLVASALNRFHLENLVKPTCRVSVYDDLPPAVRILEPSDEVSVAPGEKVTVAFEATDDLGLARAEVQVTTITAEGATNQVVLPVDLAADAGGRRIRKSIQLDPAALGLRHGDQLSYVVQVTDTREAPGQAAGGASAAAAARTPSKEDPAGELAAAEPPEAQAMARPDDGSPPEESKPEPDGAAASALASKAGTAGKSQSPRPGAGDPPPPDAMSRRALDAGQSAACQPRNIKVDEWAGSFDGEKRRKLEIAIEPVLRELDALLVQAGEKTGTVRAAAAEPAGITAKASAPLEGARGHLAESLRVIGALRSRTVDTPYAFIGLQLHNIGESHVVPAGAALAKVAAGPGAGGGNLAALDQAAFHIERARAMLADLTRTYESVKRDQQVADAMQRLGKMYQVFLEDTQALLGSSKGPINQYARKIAEVDDAYVEKLKALLEEKKKIMAELGRILAEDPRLLRRYLAMLQLQGTSFRDQMTLLAVRQKQAEEQVRAWNTAPEAERPARIAEAQARYAAAHRTVAEDAGRLRENLETWLPLDVRPDHPRVRPLLDRAERAVLLVARSAGGGGGAGVSGPGTEALDELRALRDQLPGLGGLEVTNQARLDAYIANRMAEVEALVSAQSGRLRILESLGRGDLPRAAEVEQQRITAETVTLSEKLEATGGQVASMTAEIAAKASDLNRIVSVEVIEPQKAAVEQLGKPDAPEAGRRLAAVVPAFEKAELTFDELMRMITAHLDQAPAPTSPGGAQDLESLLALLQDEMKAAEGLGLSCRPINVSVMRDWMRPGSGSQPGSGQGKGAQAQAQAARGQAQAGQSEARRLERQARDSARQALARARSEAGGREDAGARVADGKAERGEAWNRLVSKLQKDLLQGREHQPPEQYREAIAQYFKTLSDRGSEAAPTDER